jgi:hypothetical protein
MALIIGSESISEWERLPSFGHYGYAEMIKCLTIKLFSIVGYLPVYQLWGIALRKTKNLALKQR